MAKAKKKKKKRKEEKARAELLKVRVSFRAHEWSLVVAAYLSLEDVDVLLCLNISPFHFIENL